MNNPLVSVLMPIYNAERYLREAINSIFSQTFTDFEILAIDDYSTDNSLVICKSYKDERIRIINNLENIGIAKTLNKGIKLAKGKYIARMDADDICLKNRFSVQVKFMENNPQIGVCGSYAIEINEDGKKIRNHILPINVSPTVVALSCPIVHPSAMIRKEILLENPYDEDFKCAQDYALWAKLCYKTIIINIPQYLLFYRTSGNQISVTRKQEQKENSLKIKESILLSLGFEKPKEAAELLQVKNKETIERLKKLDLFFLSIYDYVEKNEPFAISDTIKSYLQHSIKISKSKTIIYLLSSAYIKKCKLHKLALKMYLDKILEMVKRKFF